MKHLHYFCEKLDDLASFFAESQNHAEDINKARVDTFSQSEKVIKTMGDQVQTQEAEAEKAATGEIGSRNT